MEGRPVVKKKNYKYGININKEYKLYNEIGYKKAKFERYSHWKKHILNKYKGYMDKEYLEDIKRYLNQKMNKKKMRDEIYNTIMIPCIIAIFSVLFVVPSIVISLNQYSDSVISDIMDTYKTTLEKLPTLFARQNVYLITSSASFVMLIFAVFIIFIFSAFLSVASMSSKKWVNFYKDYIEILDEKKSTILKN